MEQHAVNHANMSKLATEGFGKGATYYDAQRPDYTTETVEYIFKEISKPIGCCNTPQAWNSVQYKVLELGAGTGKFTQVLAPLLPDSTRYLATDPSSDFLELLQSKSLRVETAKASANSLTMLGDNSVENILCVQCFHWFSDAASLREMHRVLVPGGKVYLVWNAERFEDSCWTGDAYRERLEVAAKAGIWTKMLYHGMRWRDAIDATSSDLFSWNHHLTLPGVEYRCDIDGYLEYTKSISYYNILPEAECIQSLKKLRSAIEAYPEVDPNDMMVPYTSEIYILLSQKKQ